MKYLDLFAGGGGGSIFASLRMGWECVGRAEYDPLIRPILEARMADGTLSEVPFWKRVEEVPGLEADIYMGGFPCQPISIAGKQLASEDPRDGWPAFRDLIARGNPAWVLAENVANLLSEAMAPYWHKVLNDFVALGYVVTWVLYTSASAGGEHLRRRVWILASRTHSIKGLDCVTPVSSPSILSGSYIQGKCYPEIAPLLPSTAKYPTPLSRDWHGGRTPEALALSDRRPRNSLPEFLGHLTGVYGTTHPRFGEKLMGWPQGWTDIHHPLTRDLDLEDPPLQVRFKTEDREMPRQELRRRLHAIGNGWDARAAEGAYRLLRSRYL